MFGFVGITNFLGGMSYGLDKTHTARSGLRHGNQHVRPGRRRRRVSAVLKRLLRGLGPRLDELRCSLFGCGVFLCLIAAQVHAAPLREDFLDLARKGWVFEFRSTVLRRSSQMPAIRINSREIVAGSVCLIGATPNRQSEEVLTAFTALLASIYGARSDFVRRSGALVDCGLRHRVYIRLFEGRPPIGAFNRDLRMLDAAFGIGLPEGREQRVLSPAQAVTYFGQRGVVAHAMIKQYRGSPGDLEAAFYRSILIEELFQVFSFGMDILKFERDL